MKFLFVAGSMLTAMALLAQPKVSGSLQGEYTNADNLSTFSMNSATVSFKDKAKLDNAMFIYDLTLDLSGIASKRADSAINVQTARFITVTPMGTVVAGSGAVGGAYGVFTEFKSADKGMFYQPFSSPSAVAYVAPVVAGVKLTGALVSVNDNADLLDVYVASASYSIAGITAGASLANTSKALLGGAANDYIRLGFTAGYKAGAIKAGGVYEMNTNHPSGDSTVMGASASYQYNKANIKLGLALRDHTNDELDNMAILANTSCVVASNENTKLTSYVELENHTLSENNILRVGIVANF